MVSAIVGAILMVVLTAAGIAYPEIISAQGTKRTQRLTEIAKKIYNKISDNRELMEKLADAYQRKDADLATQLMQGAGFGPRTAAIRDAIKEAKTVYQEQKTALMKKDAELNNQYNEVNQASYNTNTIAGISNADRVADSVEQAINGGANENL
jgi:hypothetical protein